MTDKALTILVVLVFSIFVAAFASNQYMENTNNLEMAGSGLEQCSQSPDWSNSSTIWVKDCDKYMTNFAKNFKDD